MTAATKDCLLVCGLVAITVAGGCATDGKTNGRRWVAEVPRRVIVAVAPAMNLSGTTAFDPVQLADLMASELTQIEAMLVFAVTEYDPYEPPVVGLTLQLYEPLPTGPDSLEKAGSKGEPPAAGSTGPADVRPVAQLQRVYDAAVRSVRDRLRRFAGGRDDADGPWGWRKYLVSQRHFLRFCCHEAANELIGQYISRLRSRRPLSDGSAQAGELHHPGRGEIRHSMEAEP